MKKRITALITLILSCFALCACSVQDYISGARTEPESTERHTDWKSYYRSIISGGALPRELASELEKRMLPESNVSFKSYFLCDWNGDGTPELFLPSIQAKYCFVVSNDAAVIAENIYGVNFKEHALIIHGHSGGGNGSQLNEWQIIAANGDVTHIDAVFGDEILNCSVAEADGRSPDKPNERYFELFERYVAGASVLGGFSALPLSDEAGLNTVQSENEAMTELRAAAYTAYYDFLQSRAYMNYGLSFSGDIAIQKYFFDFRVDGVPELIMTNGSKDPARMQAYIFEYGSDGISYLGLGPSDAYSCQNIPGILWSCTNKDWKYYRRDRLELVEREPEPGDEYYPDETDGYAFVKSFPLIALDTDPCSFESTLRLMYFRA